MSINLASRPFENLRPVQRTKWLLIVFGVLVWGLTAVKYWDYAAGSSEETRTRLNEVNGEIASLNEQIVEAEATLQAAALEERNQRMAFLNTKLGERAFPWSQLFQDLGGVQPWPLRLHRVTPKIENDEESGLPSYAQLSLDGSARKRDVWYRFVDLMFEHPRFEAPRMISENVDEGEIDFKLTVRYRLDFAPPRKKGADPAVDVPTADTDEPATQSAASS